MSLPSVNLVRHNTALLFFAVSIACTQSTAPFEVNLRPVPDIATLNTNAGFSSFSFDAMLVNRTTSPVTAGLCGAALQRLESEKWVTVYSPVCGGGPSLTWRAGPNDSVSIPVKVVDSPDHQAVFGAKARIVPGQYRLILLVNRGNDTRSADTHLVTSPAFTVRD